MTFLNPFLLVALAAAAIPLLLHLLNLQKLRRVEFSSLRFLKELQRSRMRKLKLRQILLLVLRTLLVVFAVLAFARPAFEGGGGLPGAHATTTAVILLDNSFSMEATVGGTSIRSRARSAARDIAELLREGDEAFVVPMSDPAAAIGTSPIRSRDALLAAIDSVGVGYRRADLDDALRIASSLLERSENLNREVYIVTDAQRGNIARASDSLRLFDPQTRVYLMPLDPATSRANLAVDSLQLLSSVFEAGKPIELRAWIRNYGEERVESVPVSLMLDRVRSAQTSVSLDPGESASVTLGGTPGRGGAHEAAVEISGDPLDADNRRVVAFTVPDRLKGAAIGSAEALRYLGAAYDIFSANLAVTKLPPGSAAAVDFTAISALVLADANAGDDEAVARFVEGGGGLVLFAGPSLDRGAFNAGLGRRLGISFGEAVTSGEKPLGFSMVEREHPIFNGVFDPTSPGVVGAPEISRAMPPSGGETIIRMTNGAPFLSEFRRGSGRIIVVATPPTTSWSSLPSSRIFVPIAIRSLLYVGTRGNAAPSITVGENVTLPLPNLTPMPESVTIVRPDGREVTVPVRRYPSGAIVAYGDADQRGIYRVMANGAEVGRFAVNPGVGESDLTPMSRDDLEEAVAARIADPDRLSVLDPGRDGFDGAITEARFGMELWKYALALALICAFAEMAVARAGRSAVEA